MAENIDEDYNPSNLQIDQQEQVKSDESDQHVETPKSSIVSSSSSEETVSSSSSEETSNEETLNTDDASSDQKTSAQSDMIKRLPDYLSAGESNFLRFCHLIQKVAPQAVRHRFDQEFPPDDLEGIIQRNMVQLKDLYHRRVIPHSQWKLICPSGTTPLSSTFDVTTMVCFFRHLTDIKPMSGLYDTLPPPSDTSVGADLSRVKYYRNNIAHYVGKARQIDNADFPIVWDTASKAVSRIGGPLYEQECFNLRTANLDSSYMDMELELKHEITAIKKSQKHKNKKQKQRNKKQEKKINELQTKLEDPVPQNERENIRCLTDQWESTKPKFVETKAAKDLMKIMKTENVAIVTGSPGTGKSFTVQNVLLSMKAEGYDVIPVRSSSDLVRYYSESARQVYYLDNLCGKHNISLSDIEEWERNSEKLVEILKNSSSKCILICRLQIFRDSNFNNLNLDKYKVINLSGDHQLTLQEKVSIGEKHIEKGIIGNLSDQTIVNCPCFPLLCSLYDKNATNTSLYFEKPKTYFEAELTEMRKKPDKTKYACIVLSVMFNNKVKFNLFGKTNQEGAEMVKIVCEELGIFVPPMKTLQLCFDSMIGSFFQKTNTGYKSIHDYMLDIYCVHVSKIMIHCIIFHADSELIRDRALLQSLGNEDEYSIVIPEDLENEFFQRTLNDLSLQKVRVVFGSNQMKYKAYREKFISFFRERKLNFNITDENTTPLYVSSQLGYTDIVKFLCNERADVNQCNAYGDTPLYAASEGGHIDVVLLLCHNGSDVNHCDEMGWTPLIAASRGGYVNVVDMLCNKGADVNQCDKIGWTPLILASRGGHVKVVELLCNKGADVNQCDKIGWTPVSAASLKGHLDVVELVCNKGADVNHCDKFGISPLYVASVEGNVNVVELLCNKGADVNHCDKMGRTSLTAASGGGHIDVVELLCNIGADVNKCGKYGRTPLTAASEKGDTNVLELLCNKGADINQCDGHGITPLSVASMKGHIDVVELLCNKGADINKFGVFGSTALSKASEGGHINVVEFLCNKGADVNKYGEDGWTPLYAASVGGHVDVVELLCNKGADVNQFNNKGMTPLAVASGRGHDNVVELLRHRGAHVSVLLKEDTTD